LDKLHREQWIDRFLDWAKPQSDIRAVVLVGSNSRSDHPADEWSDIDILLIASTPQPYLDSTEWLASFGKLLFNIVERTSTGEIWVRRVLFESGLDVDFIVLSPQIVRLNFPGIPVVIEILQRGRQVLIDKDGLFNFWSDEITSRSVIQPPSRDVFLEVVNDFWFHTVWTAKKLRRGELWVATTCNNVYMKRILLQMMEWYTQATQGCERDVWFDGRFIEQWASPWVVKEVPKVIAHYDDDDVWRALKASMELFQQLASKTAEHWQYPYPVYQVEKVIEWVTECHLGKVDIK
jgi:aminoglycoside 6-adenylyltransferase